MEDNNQSNAKRQKGTDTNIVQSEVNNLSLDEIKEKTALLLQFYDKKVQEITALEKACHERANSCHEREDACVAREKACEERENTCQQWEAACKKIEEKLKEEETNYHERINDTEKTMNDMFKNFEENIQTLKTIYPDPKAPKIDKAALEWFGQRIYRH